MNKHHVPASVLRNRKRVAFLALEVSAFSRLHDLQHASTFSIRLRKLQVALLRVRHSGSFSPAIITPLSHTASNCDSLSKADYDLRNSQSFQGSRGIDEM